MSSQSSNSDTSFAKWILLATLIIIACSKLAAGQSFSERIPLPSTAVTQSGDDATVDGDKTEQTEDATDDVAEDTEPEDVSEGATEPVEPAAMSVADIYRKTTDATVEVLIGNHLSGTGWFVGNDGLIITAAHAIPKHDARIEINSSQCKRTVVKLVAIDLGTDVALLEAPARDGGYKGLKLAENSQEVGDDLYMLGTPLFRHRIMQRGMASSDEVGIEHYNMRFVEINYISSMAQAGTSGGPWVNDQCEAVGMQSGIMIVSGAPAGLCFSTPLPKIKRLVETRKSAQTATAGLMCEELWQHGDDTIKRYPPGIEALLVKSTVKDGPAARAGVRGWDLITEVDGKKVRVVADLVRAIRSKKPGESARLTLLAPDGAGRRIVEVKLGCLEVNWH